MFGLVVLLIAVAYLLISFAIVRWVIGYARKNGKSPKRWGGGAALVMFLIPFWDWIPTVATHQYYCTTEAGFWVYKTPEQWMKENLGAVLTLNGRTTSTQKEEYGYTEVHQLNQRINWVLKLHGASDALQISKREESLIDTKNNEVLARFVDFSSGDQRSTGTAKFWLVRNDCSGNEEYRARMGQLVDKIYAYAKGEKK